MELDDDKKVFISHASTVLESYQAPSMGTSKWHSLDPSVESLRHIGGIPFVLRGLDENAQQWFKYAFKLSSRCKHSAMDETPRLQLEIDSIIPKRITSFSTVKRPNTGRIESVLN